MRDHSAAQPCCGALQRYPGNSVISIRPPIFNPRALQVVVDILSNVRAMLSVPAFWATIIAHCAHNYGWCAPASRLPQFTKDLGITCVYGVRSIRGRLVSLRLRSLHVHAHQLASHAQFFKDLGVSVSATSASSRSCPI